ncbi:MAG: HlyC/CorC family transporter [Candidatus Tectomicrobia bacterium]|uniref:HlyC/CorC family transporter n=1 Tax=Tectimicrobiota bacterium TaxID=2528274 RepID=A0A932CP04_UNCTE|nr:HlyC/CorC family transporter [Candidatus Tectomicrobia bacterium]
MALVLGLLMLSAFFSGSEAALFSLGHWRLKQMEEKDHPRAKMIAALLSQPRRLILSLLIGNELVNVAASALVASLFISLLGYSSQWLAIATMTPLLLIFGEITPKVIGVKDPVRFSSWASAPLHLFVIVVTPLRALSQWIAEGIIFLLRGQATAQGNIIRQDEFRTLVDVGEKEGVLEASERELIQNVFEFGDTPVSEIMTPRTDIFSLSSDLILEEILEEIRHNPYSRIPVYQGSNKDNIVGILYAKELLIPEKVRGQWEDKAKLRNFLRPPYFIPWSKKALDLFKDFQKRKIHLAIVVDEYGGIAGLVTMENLLELLFGEIQDEYDIPEHLFQELGEDTYLVSARLPIEQFNEQMGIELPQEEDLETVGGLVFSLFGRLPQAGESVSLNGFTFFVEEIEGTQIKKIRVLKTGTRGREES